MVQIISIEGNIGSGKTTFLKKLKENYKHRKDICFLEEPLDKWLSIKDDEGNILDHFYKDKSKYSFSFQMMAYISRLAILKEKLEDKTQHYNFIITERSLFTDKEVFCKSLHNEGFISSIDYLIYNEWFYTFLQMEYKGTPIKYKHIYFKTTPTIAFHRILSRNREEEKTIEYEYIIKCNAYHNKWLSNLKDVITFDANVDLKKTDEYMQEFDKIFM